MNQGSAHEFLDAMKVHGNHVRALGIQKGVPAVLCLWRPMGENGFATFDARELAGRTVRVADRKLVSLVMAVFSSFQPPVRPPIIVTGESFDAEAGRVFPGGELVGRNVAVADFSGVSRLMFKLLYPELLFTTMNASQLLFSENVLSGTPVTCVSLETIFYGPKTFGNKELLVDTLLKRVDMTRLRELEVRFGVTLFDVAEHAARRKDEGYKRVEDSLMQAGRAYVDRPMLSDVLVPPPGRLDDPRDNITGTMTVNMRDMRDVSKKQNVKIEPGAMFMFRVGSYPERPWYVHEVFAGEVVLAPWMPVVLGRRVDYIGKNSAEREIKAVRGPVETLLQGSPEPAAGQLVGDPEKNVYGELYATRSGTWAVLGENPNGSPSQDPMVRRMAEQARRNAGGRFQHMCYNRPEVATEALCQATGGVWDRPCTRDHECPYFSSDARGGCVDGFCEMPLGVDNVAFTKPRGVPVCTNCGPYAKDPLRCCDELSDPKYAWST